MLQELKNVRRHDGEAERRWFSNSDFDLIVWLDEDGTVIAFDLCYGKQHREHVYRWRAPHELSHLRVDDGEQHSGRHKMAPIYVADGSRDAQAVARRFDAASQGIPAEIRGAVLQQLNHAR